MVEERCWRNLFFIRWKFRLGREELVGQGSLLSINPNGTILKRIVLSGHPLKIQKSSTVVRYTFFNPGELSSLFIEMMDWVTIVCFTWCQLVQTHRITKTMGKKRTYKRIFRFPGQTIRLVDLMGFHRKHHWILWDLVRNRRILVAGIRSEICDKVSNNFRYASVGFDRFRWDPCRNVRPGNSSFFSVC